MSFQDQLSVSPAQTLQAHITEPGHSCGCGNPSSVLALAQPAFFQQDHLPSLNSVIYVGPTVCFLFYSALVFETQSCSVTQAGLELAILLPQPPES